MKKQDFNIFLEKTLNEIIATSQSGQKEYALNEDAFDNFNRLAQNLKIDRKSVLFVYMQKHLDGITAYINGHKSQREDVRGRIKDVIVYSMLLWGMVNEDEMVAKIDRQLDSRVNLNSVRPPIGNTPADYEISKL